MYKLLYASRLADYGLASQALHYCEAIGAAVLSEGGSSHPVLLAELIKVSVSEVSVGVLSSVFRGAILERLKVHISSSLNTRQNWSSRLSLTTYACPDVISRGPVCTEHNWLGRGQWGWGTGEQAQHAPLEKLCSSPFLGTVKLQATVSCSNYKSEPLKIDFQ